GVLAGVAWFAPWLGQLVTIPIVAMVLARLSDPPVISETPKRGRLGLRAFSRLFRTAPIIGLQYAGSLRMFLKFAILTFLPVLLVDVRGLTPAHTGLVIGSFAITGTLMAAVSGRLSRVGRAT